MSMNIAALSLIWCLPVAAWAQTGGQEKTISLPAGVSVEYGTISRAGTLVAAIGSDNVVRVWSTNSGELLQSLGDGAHAPTCLEFSTDGRLLAVAFQIVPNEKGVLRVFDVGSWKAEHEFAAASDVFTLAFSPGNRRLALSFVTQTQIWDLTKSRSLADISPPFGGSMSLSFSGDGRWVATADNDGYVRVYDANTGKLRSTAEGFLLEPFAVTFSQNGKFVIAGGADKTISIIDPETGKVLRALSRQPELIMSLDLSADGKQVAVIYGHADHFLDVDHLALWDVDKGTILADFHKSGITILGGTFVGDRYRLAAVSDNRLSFWSLP
jgi:WD40 repeat protein